LTIVTAWRYNLIMRPRAWTIAGLVALLVVNRSDPAFRPSAPSEMPTPETPSTASQSDDPVYVCPMDPDVRTYKPGTCRRCGMALVAGVPDPVEFHLDVAVFPAAPKAKALAALQFLVRDPWKDRPVTSFNVIHEKLFHAFVVSQDLQFFQHGHPSFVADGTFQYPITFPEPGMYRVLGDFYPVGATPQLATETVFVPGASPPAPPQIGRDYSPKSDANMDVSFTTIPEQPTAGNRAQLRLTVNPVSGFEQYLGAWAHLLAASDDLIDMMHEHPFFADGGPQLEFEIVFPRPRTYRIWIQMQRNGVVNTVHFDVPVTAAGN
jgi:heavy metal-binding protein